MADWNPNSTNIKGLEWFPTLTPGVTLDALTKVAAMSVRQTSGAVIGVERVRLGAIPTRGGLYAVEVYDDESAVPADAPATTTFRPNEDVSGVSASAGWVEDDAVTVTTIYDQTDEATLDTTDYTMPVGTTDTAYAYAGRMAVGSGNLTGKRILAIRLVVVTRDGPKPGGGTQMRLGLSLGGVDYYGSAFAPGGSGNPVTASQTWLYNPSANRPWRIADAELLDTTDEYLIEATAGRGCRVYQAYLEVITVTESRIAVGVLNDSGSALTANAYNDVTMTTPTGGAWTKDGAGYHLYTVRRLSDVGALVIPQLNGPAAPNPARGYSPTLDPTYGYATAMGDPTTPVFGLVQRTTAPADSVDSQPYVAIVEAAVYNGQTAQQEFSGAAATTYTEHKALVKPNAAVGDLLVKLRKRSDSSQVGSTITWTAAEVAALPDAGNGWKLLARQGLVALLAGATQYYIEFSDATAADDGTGSGSSRKAWSILTLDTGNGFGETAGFGGTTDAATVNGGEDTQYDIATTVAAVPITPADFATAVADQALDVEAGDDCAVSVHEYVALTWTPTGLASAFAQYDIERSEDAGATWVRVAELTTEATATWGDYEARRGVSSCYRIRAVRDDGAASAWSATECETPSAQCAEWAFVTNDDPTLNVALNQRGPGLEYEFLDAGDVSFLPIYGRDYQIALRGTEHRGTRFAIVVIVQSSDTPTVEGVAVFAPLRELAEADVPYVAVLDNAGNRFLADVEVPNGNEDRYANVYVGAIEVTEITGTPAVATA